MSATILVAPSVLAAPADPEQVQYLPCQAAETVPDQPVQERFTAATSKDERGRLVNSLRGRPLDGAVLHLPEGYTGLVVEGPPAGLTGQERSLRATAAFPALTYWNYDRPPGPADTWHQAAQWTAVAKALHED